MTDDDRPPATRVADELLRGGTAPSDLPCLLKVRCRSCRTLVGWVVDTRYGPLWLGRLGTSKSRTQVRQRELGVLGTVSDGRAPVPMWVEDRRSSYLMCECPCPRNAADGPTIWRALLARKPAVEVDLPPG